VTASSESPRYGLSDEQAESWPLVTVNILTHDRAEVLRESLEAILGRLDYPKDRLEVIVVDNASTDATVEMVKRDFERVRLIENDADVGTSGWNLGLREGAGDYFLILDDDCYMLDQSLKHAVLTAQREQADLVSFRVVRIGDEQYVYNEEYDTGLLSFWGCSALLSRRAVDTLDGFDPNIFLWGFELEFTMRLLDRGLKHTFLPTVTSLHHKKPSVFTPFFYRANMRALAYIAAKHMTPRHAVGAWLTLALTVVLETLQVPAARAGIPAVVRGGWTGIRDREPLRPEVSRLYRRNLIDFLSPLAYVRGPKERLAGRREPPAEDHVMAKKRRFWRSRPELYPREPRSLRLAGAPESGRKDSPTAESPHA